MSHLPMKGALTLPEAAIEISGPQHRRAGWPIACSAVLGMALAFIPIAVSSIPPLADYPNHLARVHILTHLGGSPELAEYYRSVQGVQPNLAFDVVVGALTRVMPLEAAGRTFIALTIASLVGGVLALHRVLHRRPSLWPLLSLFFVYNRLLLWGFLGYLFTLGLALASFAAWIALDRHRVVRIVAATVLATLLYFGHLYAFGVYAVCIAGYELNGLWQQPRRLTALASAATAAIQFLPACFLFWSASPTSGAARETHWGSLWRKLGAPANLIFTYDVLLDLLCVGTIVAVVVWGLVRRRITFRRTMLGPLALLLTAFVAMPDQLFSSYAADKRLTVPILLVAIAASDWRPWDRLPALLVSASFMVRLVLIVQLWLQANTVYAEYLAAIHRIPSAAKLMVIVAHASDISLPSIPAFEIANLAAVYRHAFVPSLFTYPREAASAIAFSQKMEELAQSTPFHIWRSPALARLRDSTAGDRTGPFPPNVVSQYEYLLLVNGEDLPVAPPRGKTVYETPQFRLLELRPSAGRKAVEGG
ncbi:MAG TPA: hypothetical protein VFS39_13465 [Nitrospira sp.]|nr:hypothetical protein [Nitrospira sp.]